MRRIWPLTFRGTGALALAIASFVIAHEAGLVQLVYFGVLLCTVLAASIASLHLTRRTAVVTRALAPEVGAVGRETSVVLRVRIRSVLPTPPGRWDDAVPAGLAGTASGPLPAVPSSLGRGERAHGDTVVARYRVRGEARGIHALGPLSITVTDPFGLARRRSTLGGTTPLTVAPAVVGLGESPNAGGDGATRQAALAQLGQGADDLIARPYAHGDSMRRIHWRATARHDSLMVRQEEQEASPVATVVLDRSGERWSPAAARATGSDEAFEAAVSAAVSIAARLARSGYAVGVVDSDGAPLSEPLDGGDDDRIEAVAARLATVTARPGDSLGAIGRLLAGGDAGPVIVVTGRVGPTDADALASAAAHSALPGLLAASPSGDVLAQLGAAGWRAVAHPVGSQLARVWREALEREVSDAVA